MNIAVDIGNTCIKFAIFFPCNSQIEYRVWNIATLIDRLDNFVSQSLLQWGGEPSAGRLTLDSCSAPITWLMIQTGKLAWQRLETEILKIRPNDEFILVTHKHVPLKMDVNFPEKVGIDRLLAAYSAVDLYGSTPMLIVDAGTAITIDSVRRRTFCGGAILPGLSILSEVYPKISEKLPIVPISGFSAAGTRKPPLYPGKNTEAAIENGIYWGTVGTILQFYDLSFSKDGVLLVLTGGDAEYLLPGLTSVIPSKQIKCHASLVLEGILKCSLKKSSITCLL